MTISKALSWAKGLLKKQDVEGPEASAEFLLRQILGKDKTYLYAHPEHTLTALQLAKYEEWINKRAKHEPVWYITGKIEFLGLDLVVNEDVLIPRPETELIVERVVQEYRIKNTEYRILDVGTGSGAIILALANTISNKQSTISYFASDISEKALVVAKKNAESLFPRHSREGGNLVIQFRLGDLFEPWKGQKFDLIVANLPYIPHEDMATLAFDLTHFEPRTALDGGHEGLEIYERFFAEVGKHLNPGGKVFCEIGYDQGEKIQKLLSDIVPKANVTVLGDYADIDRIVIIEF